MTPFRGRRQSAFGICQRHDARVRYLRWKPGDRPLARAPPGRPATDRRLPQACVIPYARCLEHWQHRAPHHWPRDMNKIAVITDLHANREAVEAVLSHARAQGVTSYALLGDFVG